MDSPQILPLTRLLLLNVPEHHQRKYPKAVEVLNRCATFLTQEAVSNDMKMCIATEQIKTKELQAQVARMSIFLGLLQQSCFDIMNGADNSIKPEVQALLETLALSKLGAKSRQLQELMGIPAAFNNTAILSPHTKHVLKIVLANKIRAQPQSRRQSKLPDMSFTQQRIVQQLHKISKEATDYDRVSTNQEELIMARNKKNLTKMDNRLKCLINEQMIDYFNIKKKELEICKSLLGPGAIENLPKVVEKLKTEYTDQVKSNRDKAQKLELYESLGPEFKKLASVCLDLEKKIKYTRVTLNQLDSMFK